LAWVALTIAAALGAGLEAQRRGGAAATALARRGLKVMLFAFTPLVTFVNVAHLELTADIGGGVLAGWLALALAGAAGWALGRFVLDLPPPSNGVLINTAMQSNTGYLGIPLCAAVLGFDHLPQAVAYDSFVQQPVFLLGVFGVAAATGTRAGDTPRRRVRAFLSRNPPLLASIAGLIAPASLAPDVLVHVSRGLVFAMLPLGFFAVGVTLAAEAEDGRARFPPRLTPAIGAALGLRLGLAPLLLLAIAAPFIDLPAAYLLLAAMPAGLNGITVAHVFGLDLRLAAGAIAWSTLVAVVAGLAVTAVV
jgi:predicted permease